MIDKNKKTNTYHAICDCCYEMSDEYDSFNECLHGINTTAGKATMTSRRENGRICVRIAGRADGGKT